MLFSAAQQAQSARDDLIRPEWQQPESNIFFRKSTAKEVFQQKPKQSPLMKNESLKLLQDLFFAHHAPERLLKFCRPRQIELQHCFEAQEQALSSDIESLRGKLENVSKNLQSAAVATALRTELQQQQENLDILQYMKRLMSQDCNTFVMYRMSLEWQKQQQEQDEESKRLSSSSSSSLSGSANSAQKSKYVDPFDEEEKRLFGSLASDQRNAAAAATGGLPPLYDPIRQKLVEYYGYIYGERPYEESMTINARQWKNRETVLPTAFEEQDAMRKQVSAAREVCRPCLAHIEHMLNCPLAAFFTHAEEISALSCNRELAEYRVPHYALDSAQTDFRWHQFSKCIDSRLTYLEKHGKPIELRKSIERSMFQRDTREPTSKEHRR